LVRRGDSEVELVIAYELNDGLLLEYLLETKQKRNLRICRTDGLILLRANKLDDDNCCISWSIYFSLFKFVGDDEAGNFEMSMRNGQAIYNPKCAPSVNPSTAHMMVEGQSTYQEIRKGLDELRARLSTQT
jgi:hypothetical protein